MSGESIGVEPGAGDPYPGGTLKYQRKRRGVRSRRRWTWTRDSDLPAPTAQTKQRCAGEAGQTRGGGDHHDLVLEQQVVGAVADGGQELARVAPGKPVVVDAVADVVERVER